MKEVDPNYIPTEDEIIEYCRGTLAAYKVPRQVQFVDDVPKTSTGTIMRRLLRDIASGKDSNQDTPTLEDASILEKLRGNKTDHQE